MLVATLVYTAGCAASAPTRGSAPPESVTVVIDNTRSGASSLTIYITPPGAPDMVRLGTVRLSEEKTLIFDRRLRTSRYVLIGRETGGEEITSRVFTLTPGDQVEWDVSRNRLWVGKPDGGP